MDNRSDRREALLTDDLPRKKQPTSRILEAFYTAFHWLYQTAMATWLGKFMLSYYTVQKKFQQGSLRRKKRNPATPSQNLNRRMGIVRGIEKSTILRVMGTASEYLLSVSLSVYGLFFLLFGGVSTVVAIISSGIHGISFVFSSRFIEGILLTLPSFAFLLSSRTLADGLRHSWFGRNVLIGFFGIPRDKYRVNNDVPREPFLGGVLLGIALGLTSIFFSPWVWVGILVGLVLFRWILQYSEIGVLLTFLLFPFINLSPVVKIVLAGFVFSTFLSYLIKVLCRRRNFRMEFLDVLVLLFSLTVFCGGIGSFGGRESLLDSFLYGGMILEYFIVVNIMRSEEWLQRCLKAMTIPVVFLSIFELVQYLLQFVSGLDGMPDWAGSFFSSNFWPMSNSVSFSLYLLVLFPLALSKLYLEKSAGYTMLRMLCVLLVIGAMALFGPSNIWLGIFLAVVLFLIIFSYKGLSLLFIVAVPTTCLILALPAQIQKAILDCFRLPAETMSYRMSVWEGSWQMLKEHLIGGIGFGQSAFEQAYPLYSLPGFENASAVYNSFLSIWLSVGLFGLILFVVMMVVYLQKAMSYLHYRKDEFRPVVIACVSGNIAVLVLSFMNEGFFDARVFFAFISVMAIAVSYMRVGDEQFERDSTNSYLSGNSADVVLTTSL